MTISMLKEIFNSITPDNLKDIPLMRDSMDVFIKTIEEKCQVSEEIRNIFNEKNNDVARDEFIKIYLDDLNRYFTEAQTNEEITKEIELKNTNPFNNIPRDFIGDLTKLFTNEHFVTSKAFKQKKGTEEAIRYIYNLIESLIVPANERGSFEFTSLEPFHFNVDGGLPESVYNNMVKPLAHPLGFTYVYLQVVKLLLEDKYGCDELKKNISIEVRCLSGNIDAYGNGSMVECTATGYYDGNIIIYDGNTNLYDPNNPQYICVNPDPVFVYTGPYNMIYDGAIRSIHEGYQDTIPEVKIVFDNGSYLVQTFNPIHVIYYNADGTINKNYLGHCSIALSYDTITTAWTKDDLTIDPTSHLWDSWCLEKDSYGPYPTPSNYCEPAWDFIIGEFVVGDGGIIGSNSRHNMFDELTFEVTFNTKTWQHLPYQQSWHINDGKNLNGPETFLGPLDPQDYEDDYTTDAYIISYEVRDWELSYVETSSVNDTYIGIVGDTLDMTPNHVLSDTNILPTDNTLASEVAPQYVDTYDVTVEIDDSTGWSATLI